MRTITRLFVGILLFEFPVVASSHLDRRQEGEAWPDSNFGAALLGGAAAGVGGLINGAVNFFQDLGDSDSSNPTPIPNTGSTSNTESPPVSPQAVPDSPPPDPSSSPEGVYQLEINNGPAPTMTPNTDPSEIVPLENEHCDPKNENVAECENAIDQLVFTSSCERIDPSQVSTDAARAQNQAIKDILTEMVAQNTLAGIQWMGLRTSTSKICDVLLFAVPLTPKQIHDVMSTPGVRAVVPNQAIEIDEFPGSSYQEDEQPAETPIPASSKRAYMRKRDDIITDYDAYEDLKHISRAPNTPPPRFYAYSAEAGEYTTIIALDSGVNILHQEFTRDTTIIEASLYGLDSSNMPVDYTGFGTCRTSKAGGPRYGVSKKARLVIAKLAPSMGSLLDLLVQILDFLNNKIYNGERVLGYHVMSILARWDNEDEEISRAFESLIDLMMRYFKIVVVVPSGTDRTQANSDINMWPATIERRYPIIVVGAIQVSTGITYPWSRGGPLLSVLAPGKVKCARDSAGNGVVFKYGTDVAALQTAGLVAYLLSHKTIGPFLRRDLSAVSSNVKDYIMTTASYARRPGGVPSIYNMVGDLLNGQR